eukprot:jgi/Psemu1/328693/estExt_fgenesh1_pg.C_19600001
MKFLADPAVERVNLILSSSSSSNKNKNKNKNKYAARITQWKDKGVVHVVSAVSLWDAIKELDVPSESVLWMDADQLHQPATTIAMGMLLGTIGEGYVVDEYEYEFAHKYANQYAQEHAQEHGAGTGKKEPGDDDEPATVGDRNSNSNNRLQWMVEELSDYFGCSCQGSAIAIPRWMLSSSSSALQQQQACTDDPGPGSLLQ